MARLRILNIALHFTLIVSARAHDPSDEFFLQLLAGTRPFAHPYSVASRLAAVRAGLAAPIRLRPACSLGKSGTRDPKADIIKVGDTPPRAGPRLDFLAH